MNGSPNEKLDERRGWLGLDPELVGKLLQASVTGAGLVFVVYALLLPRADSILERRAKVLAQAWADLFTRPKEKPEKDIEDLARRIAVLSELPWILRSGILLAFVCYGISSFLAWNWLVYPDWWEGKSFEIVRLPFGIATFVFTLLGVGTIWETGNVLQQSWELLKKRIKDKSESSS